MSRGGGPRQPNSGYQKDGYQQGPKPYNQGNGSYSKQGGYTQNSGYQQDGGYRNNGGGHMGGNKQHNNYFQPNQQDNSNG